MNNLFNFTQKEIEILKHVSKGKYRKQVAKDIHMSVYTLDTHLKSIYLKSGVKHYNALVAFAIKNGFDE